MNTAQMSTLQTASNQKQSTRILQLAAALAGLTALAYVLIALGALPTGSLTAEEGPAGIIYTAAGCYLAGGLLILARRRWLWALGAVINALVLVFFFQMYANRPAVLLSPGGLVSKAFQVLLEAALLYLIFTRTSRPGKAQ